MYILNISSTIKKMSVNEPRDFIFENYSKRIWFVKKNIIQLNAWFLIAYKLVENISDPRNAKEHYQSFIRKKNTRSVKQSEIIAYQPKAFENPNIVDKKSVIIEHPETLLNFSRL